MRRFTPRLAREVKASPKKAAALGLLLVVALYYWVPLVQEWMSAREVHADLAVALPAAERATPAAVASPASETSVEPAPGASADQPFGGWPWQAVVSTMEGDPRTRPVAEPPSGRDPFRPVVREIAQEKPDDEPEEAAPAELAETTPEALGIELSSTLIGPQRRLALINGRPFLEGRRIAWQKDGQSLEFLLREVRPKSIILEREGRQFELQIPDSAADGRLEMYGRARD